jgi:mono/diheme cytochrome c family protein
MILFGILRGIDGWRMSGNLDWLAGQDIYSFETMKRLLLCFASALLLLSTSDLAAQPTRSTRDGVFSKAQADRGRDVFVTVCANCHTRGQFSDGTWRRKWEGRTVFDVLESIRTTMPNDNPSGLSDGEYLDVITYLLAQNGYPAGAQDASEAALKKVRIESPSSASDHSTAHVRTRPPS